MGSGRAQDRTETSIYDRVDADGASEWKVFVRFHFLGAEDRSPIAGDRVFEFLAAGDEVACRTTWGVVVAPPCGSFRVGELGVDRNERVDGELECVIERVEDGEFGVAPEIVRRDGQMGSQRPLRLRAVRRGRSFSGGVKVSR